MKRNFILLASLILVIFMAMPSLVQAQSGQRDVHVVQAGETLYRISRMYDVSVDDIRGWNGLSGNTISVGQRLIVSAPAGEQVQRPVEVTSGDRPAERVLHRVGAGETLFSISRRYGVTVAEIRNWNNLTSNLIEVGQVLEILESTQNVTEEQTAAQTEEGEEPASDSTDAGSGLVITDTIDAIPTEELIIAEGDTLAATEPLPDGEAIRFGPVSSAYYVVRSGDTVSQIARRFGISSAELRELNQLRSDRLAVGQVLMIRRPQGLPSVGEGVDSSTPQGRFTTYEVRRGDRLNAVLERFSMTESELQALNPDFDVTALRQGQQLVVLLPPDITYENPYRVAEVTDTRQSESLSDEQVFRYADTDRGRSTTSGDLYNPSGYTASHNRLPLGSVVFVQHPENGNGIFVLINDRMVESGIKLSHAAYDALGFAPNRSNRAVILADEQ